MTVSIGQHVHPVGKPDVDLVVDSVAPQGAGSAWLHTHDAAGHDRYVAADEVESSDGKHALVDGEWAPWWAPRLLWQLRTPFPPVRPPHRHAAPETDAVAGAS